MFATTNQGNYLVYQWYHLSFPRWLYNSLAFLHEIYSRQLICRRHTFILKNNKHIFLLMYASLKARSFNSFINCFSISKICIYMTLTKLRYYCRTLSLNKDCRRETMTSRFWSVPSKSYSFTSEVEEASYIW